MAHKKIGKQTFQFSSQPIVDSWASVVGPKEGVGPLVNNLTMSWKIIWLVKRLGKKQNKNDAVFYGIGFGEKGAFT